MVSGKHGKQLCVLEIHLKWSNIEISFLVRFENVQSCCLKILTISKILKYHVLRSQMCFFEKKKQTKQWKCPVLKSQVFFFLGKNSEPNGPTFEEKILKEIENLIAIDMRSRYEVRDGHKLCTWQASRRNEGRSWIWETNQNSKSFRTRENPLCLCFVEAGFSIRSQKGWCIYPDGDIPSIKVMT